MKTIYIDSDFKCHTIDDGTLRAIETDFFDRKCDAYIESFRFVPLGESWTRSDGTVFDGEMAAPHMPIDGAQLEQEFYERQLLEQYAEALKMLGVEV